VLKPYRAKNEFMSRIDARSGSDPQSVAASKQDGSRLSREIQRRFLLALPRLRRLDRSRREFARRISGSPHRIDFFHQVDDPYSELAIQAIAELRNRYRVDFRFFLVSQTDRTHAPEQELLMEYAMRDCAWIAPHYGLEFPQNASRPREDRLRRVEGMLAGLTTDSRFLDVALAAGRALWKHDSRDLDVLEERIPVLSRDETQRQLADGNALRRRRRHYSGAMFWYAGDWYWGVDRLHHLERRLIELGAAGSEGKSLDGSNTEPRFDRPALDAGAIQDVGQLRLEIFPSIRSPYTALIFERSMQVARQVGVPVTIRPVMPMVMRGVPVPAAKGLYIMLDAIREAEHIGVPFGNMLDPIGRPVERGFSLWPFANERGRGEEFLAEFLRAAFALGQPTGTDEALERIVEKAGLCFQDAIPYLDNDSWRAELEANRQLMYEELGLWGVPSYRLRGPGDEPELCVWGQDRLWLVAAEIRRRLADANRS
jgi:2-hydroxychromene-2-carboxylate isomerase